MRKPYRSRSSVWGFLSDNEGWVAPVLLISVMALVLLVVIVFATQDVSESRRECIRQTAVIAVQDGRTTNDAYDYARLMCSVNDNKVQP